MKGSQPSFLERLRNAGIDPADDDETKLNKSLLMFATGLVSIASILWLIIYWSLGPQLSVYRLGLSGHGLATQAASRMA